MCKLDFKDDTVDRIKEVCDYVCKHNDSVRINTEKLDYLKEIIDRKGHDMPCSDIQTANKFLDPREMGVHEFVDFLDEKTGRELMEKQLKAVGESGSVGVGISMESVYLWLSDFSQEEIREIYCKMGIAYGFLYIEQSESKND